MRHRDGVLASRCLQIKLFSLFLMQLPVILARGRSEQLALLFLDGSLLSFFGGVFLGAIRQFLFSQLLSAWTKRSIRLGQPEQILGIRMKVDKTIGQKNRRAKTSAIDRQLNIMAHRWFHFAKVRGLFA